MGVVELLSLGLVAWVVLSAVLAVLSGRVFAWHHKTLSAPEYADERRVPGVVDVLAQRSA